MLGLRVVLASAHSFFHEIFSLSGPKVNLDISNRDYVHRHM